MEGRFGALKHKARSTQGTWRVRQNLYFFTFLRDREVQVL